MPVRHLPRMIHVLSLRVGEQAEDIKASVDVPPNWSAIYDRLTTFLHSTKSIQPSLVEDYARAPVDYVQRASVQVRLNDAA